MNNADIVRQTINDLEQEKQRLRLTDNWFEKCTANKEIEELNNHIAWLLSYRKRLNNEQQ